MTVACFPSLPEGETAEVEFLSREGGAVPFRLLVDCGFTGASSFVLPPSAAVLAVAPAPDRETGGALQGRQTRVVVWCRIPLLAFRRPLIAILADVSPLKLPSGVQGLAGLTFLRQFERWGAEHVSNGSWRFFLSGTAVQ